MIKKLTRHGNSRALVIDKGVLELLHIDDDTPLNITTDGNILIVAPVNNIKGRRAFEQAMKEVNARYGKALKRLA